MVNSINDCHGVFIFVYLIQNTGGIIIWVSQRHRRWASIVLALGRRLVFAGYQPILQCYCDSNLMMML